MVNNSYCKFIVLFLTAILLASCVSQKSNVAGRHATKQNDIIEYGKKYLHKPYSFSGKGPHSFDCSGFTSFVFKEFGYNLNSSSAGQAQQGEAINRKEDLQVGDLVFFEGRSHNGRVGHVGIVSEVKRNGKFKFLHASTNYGVIFSSSDEPYYNQRYLRGSRVLKDMPGQNKKSNLQQTSNASLGKNNAINTSQTNNTIVSPTVSSATTTAQLANKESSTVAIHTRAVTTNEKDAAIAPDQANKPAKNKKTEDKEKKRPDSKSLIATTLSEESILPPPIKTTHVVRPGETLFSISKMYNCSVNELQEWNPALEDDVIRAGDKLNINK